MSIEIELRDSVEGDYPILFEFMRDGTSATMAAFGTRDADASQFAARWKASVTDGAARKAVVEGGAVVGFVATFLLEGKPQVTYWIARSRWGRGIATAALQELLKRVAARPLYASAAADNLGSLRVLEKCGFRAVRSARAFAAARGQDVEEVFLELR